jgi:hypothetical protein
MSIGKPASPSLAVLTGAVLPLVAAGTLCANDSGGVLPLINAHAHNDYAHARPLFDALEHGFCSVEADVFLVHQKLLVGHEQKDLNPERTLQRLYLDPLRQQVRSHGGSVFVNPARFFLLIDVKTEANSTYLTLDRVLAGYADVLSCTDKGKFSPGAITVVISGNRAIDVMSKQLKRFAGFDGRLSDLDSKVPTDLMPWLSDRWGRTFRWQGRGPMPAREKAQLHSYVTRAHQHGRLLRFWGTPEREECWHALLSEGVDLLNTDRLPQLQKFLLTNRAADKR